MPEPADSSADPRLKELKGVIDAYEKPLLGYVSRLLGDGSLFAEDIVQNTFLKLIRSWKDALAPSPALSSWLYRVARNEMIDFVRKEKRRRLLHAEHGGEIIGGQDAPNDPRELSGGVSDQALGAAEALQKLTERERELVILKVYEEKSYKEIADITGLSVSNVGFILHTAMKKLATMLSKKEASR